MSSSRSPSFKALFLLLILFRLSVSALTFTPEEQQWITEHPVLTYSEVDWIPMSIIKDGTMTGILGEYLRLIAKATGLEFKYVPSASWPDALESFEAHKIDLLPGVGENAYESSLGLTSKTFATFPFVLVTKTDQPFIDGIDEIEDDDKSIAVPKYWSSYNYLVTKHPDVKVIGTTGVMEALELVRTGKAYAFLGHRAIAMHYVSNYYADDLRIAGKIKYEFDHQLLFHREDTLLKSIIDKAIASITEDERLAIRHKWLTVKVEAAQDFSFLWKYLVLMLLLFGLFLYWNRKLSREVIRRRDSEEALKVEKENFKVLFEKVSDGNLIIQNGKFITANEAALKMLGLKTLSELLDTAPSQWSPSSQEDGRASDKKADELIQRCLDTGDQRFEWIHKDSSGREFWVDVGLTKISYHGADAVYVVWRDIREQKELEESLKQSEAQIRMILDLIPLLVIVTSYDGKILMANPQASNEYGFTPEVLREVNILEYYADQKERDIILQTLQAYGKVEQRIVKFKIRGDIHAMMLSILPIEYAQQGALLSIAVDMTERLKMEDALIDAKDSADIANRSKSEFLANMSHEIRTPMNAIIGFTELLNEQVLEPRQRSYVKTIQSAGNTLLTLINDILDLSKIEAGKLDIEKRPTDLFSLSDEIGSFFMMSVQDKGLRLIVDVDEKVPRSVLVDAVRLRQVLLNLVGNAVKFTEYGQIRLLVSLSREDRKLGEVDLEISVEDSGIGIPADQIEHVFKDFAQRDGQDNRKFGGTGLGLSISRHLSEMMGGVITVESQVGIGTIFRLHLYGVEAAAVRKEGHTKDVTLLDAHAIKFKPAKIMVVDDNPDNRELIFSIFEDTAIEVVGAADGLEAIAQFEADRPDLILMDIRMPNMDGYTAAAKIKEIADVPIVALTASVMHDDLDERKREDFDDYLRKPVLRDELFRSLSRFLDVTTIAKTSNKSEQFTLSKKAKANLAIILKTLSDEVTPAYEQAMKSNNITEIKKMASLVHQLAEQYDVDLLERYAIRLDEAVDAFDIARMQLLLHEYTSIVDRLGQF